MFDSKHYVPILKWKAAERLALEKLSDERKKFITPLIQLVMPRPSQKKNEKSKTIEEQLQESISKLKIILPGISKEILKYWGSTPAFIDVSLIDASLRANALEIILKEGMALGINLIPVLNINANPDLLKKNITMAEENNHGVCLRLFRSDFSNQTVNQKIKSFLAEYDFREKDVDLLIDFQITDGQCSDFSDISKQIPDISKWRTFTFASGSFPIDLSDCELGENIISRSDWDNWLMQIRTANLQRKPSFADYTIQYPMYKESFQFFLPSASIRYTLEDGWLIMRGQKGKNVQYLANAQLLSKHTKFFGANFSYGDDFINEKGKDLKGKPGNATNWLVAGINHHLACTANQIASLS